MDPLAWVCEQGVVLQSARGPVPNLAEQIAGEPIRGSWWGHASGHEIFAVLNRVRASGDVVATRLIEGRVTLVHRRIWPALVRVADRFPPSGWQLLTSSTLPPGPTRPSRSRSRGGSARGRCCSNTSQRRRSPRAASRLPALTTMLGRREGGVRRKSTRGRSPPQGGGFSRAPALTLEARLAARRAGVESPSARARAGSRAEACAGRSRRGSRRSSRTGAGGRRSPCTCSRARSAAAPPAREA